MTVKELIKELQDLPQDLPVYGVDNEMGDVYGMHDVEVDKWMVLGKGMVEMVVIH